jgi:hypothetical protein
MKGIVYMRELLNPVYKEKKQRVLDLKYNEENSKQPRFICVIDTRDNPLTFGQ